MSEQYVPTTEEVRDFITQVRGTGSSLARAQAEAIGEWFDRWLAEHDRQKQAEAWDEGYDASALDSRQPVSANATVNPYREVTE